MDKLILTTTDTLEEIPSSIPMVPRSLLSDKIVVPPQYWNDKAIQENKDMEEARLRYQFYINEFTHTFIYLVIFICNHLYMYLYTYVYTFLYIHRIKTWRKKDSGIIVIIGILMYICAPIIEYEYT